VTTRHRDACPLCGNRGRTLHDGLTDRLHETPGHWDLIACQEADCGLVWIDPVPGPNVLARAYETYFTHTAPREPSPLRSLYLKARHHYLCARFSYPARQCPWALRLAGRMMASLPHRRAAFDASVLWLPSQPGGKVLEIGCGNGELLAHLRSLGWTCRGVEPDARSAAIARARGLDIIEGGALTDNLIPPESVDAIVMSHAIEHLNDPGEVLRRCHRILRPGGRIVMLTPNLRSFGHRRFGRNWLHLDPPRHLYLFTGLSLGRLAKAAGFDSIDSFTVLRDANWTLGASKRLREGGHYAVGRLPLRLKAFGLLMTYVECLLMQFDASLGEELVVRARKSAVQGTR